MKTLSLQFMYLSFLACFLLPGKLSAQEPQYLSFEKPIVGTIEKAERKTFRVRVEAGDFAHVEVQQNLIFVHPVVFSAKGEKLFQIRRPLDYLAIKRFTLISETEAKEFIIELTGDRRDAHGNRFGIKIARKGKINDEIRMRYDAEQKLFSIPVFPTDFSDKDDVLRKFDSILETARKLNDLEFEARMLETIGDYYYGIFRNSLAVSNFEKALEIYQKINAKSGAAAVLAAIGVSSIYLGENDKALDALQRSIRLYEELKNPWGITRVLNSLSQFHYRLGQYSQAKESSLKGIESYGGISTPRTLIYLGNANFALGEYHEALKNYQLALDGMKQDSDQIMYNRTLWRIGEVYIPIGNYEKASEYFEEVVRREEKEKKFWSRNGALTGLGIINYKLGNYEKSLGYFADSITANLEAEDRFAEALSRYWIARIENERGNLLRALEEIKKAVEISENLRSKISVEEFKNSYTAKISDYYELNIEILDKLRKQNPDSDYALQAFNVSERSRARTFLELMKDSQFDFRRSVSPDLLNSEKDLQSRINEKALVKSQSQRLGNNKDELEKHEQELRKLAADLDAVRAKIRKQNPQYAALTQNLPTITLDELQKNILDSDTALIEYKLGKERSFAWVISANSFEMYELPQSEIIETKARELYSLLTGGSRLTRGVLSVENVHADEKKDEIAVAIREFSRLVIDPLADGVAGKKRLILVTDEVLQYVPFAALQLKSEYLVKRFEITNVPSATVLGELRKRNVKVAGKRKSLAVVADPVFDKNDSRVAIQRKAGFSYGELPRLLFSRQEATAIASMLPKDDVFLALGFDADKSLVDGNRLSQYRIAHFATHGFLDSKTPQLSGLAFSMVDRNGKPQNGFLRLHEVYGLSIPADLVVLSGCQTAMGKSVRGEGLIGLTRGFMYAGAAKVAASLWQVDDAATAELMKLFYEEMIRGKLTPSAALRSAQIKMESHKRWENPYYWAAFTVQGDWK